MVEIVRVFGIEPAPSSGLFVGSAQVCRVICFLLLWHLLSLDRVTYHLLLLSGQRIQRNTKFLTYDIGMNRTAIFIAKFFDNFPNRGVEEITYGILSSPVLAFRFAQVWERAKTERIHPFDEKSRRQFVKGLLLQATESLSFEQLDLIEEESSLKALDCYLGTVSRLLKQWRACDQDPVRWWKEKGNVKHMRMVRRAVAATGFTLRCEKDAWSTRPKPPWASIRDESFVKPTWASENSSRFFTRFRNAPFEVVKSAPFLREALPPIEAARTVAYLLFGEVLVRKLIVEFCGHCDLAFLPGKRTKYCSKQCGHTDSGRQSKSKTQAAKNQKRVRVASEAIAAWIGSLSKKDWRLKAENALFKEEDIKGKPLISNGAGKSQWLGRCIRAAGSPDDSPKRARLAELCTGPGPSEEERKKVSKDLNAFYALIRQAQDRERSFKAKRATAPAANAARHPKAGPA